MKPLLISIPKSGTHMMNQACSKECINIPYGSMLYESSPSQLTISALKTYNHFARTHIAYHPEYERQLEVNYIKAVFIYRDPRDSLISYFHWTKKLGLSGNSIPGIISDVDSYLNSNNPFLSMMEWWGAHIRRYIPWLFVPSVLSIKYEDMVNNRQSTLEKVAEFWGYYFGSAEEMAARINPKNSPVFRVGTTENWKQGFTPEHICKFNSILGDVLKLMGYLV